jgi:hypothetical protein
MLPTRRGDGQFALPTKEEMSHLRETEDLFKSNLLRCDSQPWARAPRPATPPDPCPYRLEVGELLSEVKAPAAGSKQAKALESFLFRVREVLLGLPARDLPMKPAVAGVPVLEHPQSALPASFRFLPPTVIDVVGSYLLRTASQPVCGPSLSQPPHG